MAGASLSPPPVVRGPSVHERRPHHERAIGWVNAALDGAKSPRLVRVREPDQLGVKRTHPHLTLCARLVQLGQRDRHVAANDDRMPLSPDHNDLHAAGVARRREEPEPGKQLVLAVRLVSVDA